MKLLRKVGSTSEIWQIFIRDSSSTTGAGLTGLTNASGSLTAYYHRDTDTTATAISLVTMTVGTFTSSGFKEIDATNLPGTYQFCPPNAALASGAKSCIFLLKGAANMAPLPIEVDLDGQVDVTHWNGTAVASPATAGIPEVNVKNVNNVATTSVTTVSANQGTTQPVNFTGTGGSALVKSDAIDWNSVAVTGMPMPTYTQPTGFLAATFPSGTIANTTNITAGTITTATNTTNAPTAGDFTATMKTSLNAATPAVTVSNKTGFSLLSTGLDLVLVDGKTLPAALQIIGASVAGKISGAGSGTEVFLGLDGSTTRLTVTVDVDGNRTATVYG